MRKTLIAVLSLSLAAPLLANEVDRNFVDGMIMHHQHGIEMTGMAIRKAENEDLRRLARKMADDQRKDNEELQKMRSEAENPNRPELARHARHDGHEHALAREQERP